MIKKTYFGRKILIVVSVLYFASVISSIMFIFYFQNRLIETSAIDSAQLLSDALSEFRTMYTAKVVEKVKNHPDINVTHEYETIKNAIPLPATLSMELGEKIGRSLSGAETYLYSPYPFPWRIESGGLRDEFRREAWNALNENPDIPYFKITQYKGQKAIRFATADLMRPECVNCHNNHPDTPKTGWKTGDVRGVLEIIHNIEIITDHHKTGIQGLYLFASLITLFGFTGLYLLMINNFTSVKDFISQKKLASLGVISAKMAHEVSQPLGAALLRTQQLRRYIDSKQFEKLPVQSDKLIANLNRINSIISQLAKAGKTVGSFNDEVLNLNHVIEATVKELDADLGADQIVLDLSLSGEALYIKADKTEIERVIVNLIRNAIHAVKDNTVDKKIHVVTSIAKKYAIIKVVDNGYGISEETKEYIFDPFFTTKSVGEATGLGLAMCFGIITALDGDIEAESNPDQGSTFTVKIPLSNVVVGCDTEESE
jgi:signal transduction histidine kinase